MTSRSASLSSSRTVTKIAQIPALGVTDAGRLVTSELAEPN